jgi:peptide deformylase
MAIRIIRTDEDPLLRKKSRIVADTNERLHVLLDDMKETMDAADGVGLAAPQVGVLKRVIITDIGEGVMEFINPEICEAHGEECAIEGCLSIPDVSGRVLRPKTIKVKAQNRWGEPFEIMAEDLLARVICHEIDHLNGVLFTDIMLPADEDEDEDESETTAAGGDHSGKNIG